MLLVRNRADGTEGRRASRSVAMDAVTRKQLRYRHTETSRRLAGLMDVPPSLVFTALATAALTACGAPTHAPARSPVPEAAPDAPDQKIDETIRAKLARKEKIPGFGHRVYRTEDPRATHLRQMSQELGQKAGNLKWFRMSQRIEGLVKAEKKLWANVDFYSASTYYALGIPPELFTPVFAVSRVSGWTAHILEQYAHNRLIRPRAEYIGPAYPQTYIPLDRR